MPVSAAARPNGPVEGLRPIEAAHVRQLLQNVCDDAMAAGTFISVSAAVPERQSLKVVSRSGRHITAFDGVDDFGHGVAAAAFRQARTCVADMRDSQEYRSWPAEHPAQGVGAVVAVPFFRAEHCGGVLLFLVADADRMTADMLDRIEAVARGASGALVEAGMEPAPE